MSQLDTSRPFATVYPPEVRPDGVNCHEQDGKLFGPDGQELGDPAIAAAFDALEAQGALGPGLNGPEVCRRVTGEMMRQGYGQLPNGTTHWAIWDMYVRRNPSATAPPS